MARRSGAAGPPPVTRRASDAAESATAPAAGWWDAEAAAYLDEHGAFLGDARFVWCPEGLSEADAGLLGDVAGRRVLEVGCGAAQCARWLLAPGADPVGARPLAGDAAPRAGGSGARPGSTCRWCRPTRPRCRSRDGVLRPGLLGVRRGAVRRRLGRGDARGGPGAAAGRALGVLGDPPGALVASRTTRARPGWWRAHSYFDRHAVRRAGRRRARRPTSSTTARSATGCARSSAPGCGWSTWSSRSGRPDNTRTWGGWSPLRGRVIPGTAIFVCEKA